MALINISLDFKAGLTYLRRIAEALEAMNPPPAEPMDIKPEEAVTYVDEEAMAERELREELNAVERAYREQREREQEEQADGGLGVFTSGDRE